MDVLDFPCFQPTLVGFTPCLAVGSAPPGSPRCQSLCQSLIPAKGPGTAGQGPYSALPGAGSPQGWAHLPLPARLPFLLVPSRLGMDAQTGDGCMDWAVSFPNLPLPCTVGDSPAPSCPHWCLEPSCAPSSCPALEQKHPGLRKGGCLLSGTDWQCQAKGCCCSRGSASLWKLLSEQEVVPGGWEGDPGCSGQSCCVAGAASSGISQSFALTFLPHQHQLEAQTFTRPALWRS